MFTKTKEDREICTKLGVPHTHTQPRQAIHRKTDRNRFASLSLFLPPTYPPDTPDPRGNKTIKLEFFLKNAQPDKRSDFLSHEKEKRKTQTSTFQDRNRATKTEEQTDTKMT